VGSIWQWPAVSVTIYHKRNINVEWQSVPYLWINNLANCESESIDKGSPTD